MRKTKRDWCLQAAWVAPSP